MASAQQIAAALADLSTADQTLSVQNYAIDHVVAGGAADGSTAVFLSIGGSVLQVPYLDSLTSPVAAQMVRVLIANNSPTILGRVIGTTS
jgi:hypothetical protein